MTHSALQREDAEAIVGDAVLAPSLHNTQPWRFRVASGEIEVRADAFRAAPVVDPLGRALTVSVGAAVLNLRLAVAVRRHRQPVVRRVPDPQDPTLLAVLQIAGPHQPTAEELLLHDALPRRRVSREPFLDARVDAEVLERLAVAATREGATLRVLDDDAARWVLRLAADAERHWESDEAYQAELARWTGGALRDDGVPELAAGPRDRTGRVPVRDFGAATRRSPRQGLSFESAPQLAVLTTAADRTVDRLRAGEALQRLWLTATAAGVGVGLLHQPVEVADLRRLLRPPAAGFEHAQMVLRLGHPANDRLAQAPTRRRPVAEVMDFVPDGWTREDPADTGR